LVLGIKVTFHTNEHLLQLSESNAVIMLLYWHKQHVKSLYIIMLHQHPTTLQGHDSSNIKGTSYSWWSIGSIARRYAGVGWSGDNAPPTSQPDITSALQQSVMSTVD